MKRIPKRCPKCSQPFDNKCPTCAPADVRRRQANRPDKAQQKAYHTTEYKRARAACITRWHNQCGICTRGDNLTVHHIDHNVWNNHPRNLACICSTCHMKLEREHQTENPTGPMHRALAEALNAAT